MAINFAVKIPFVILTITARNKEEKNKTDKTSF